MMKREIRAIVVFLGCLVLSGVACAGSAKDAWYGLVGEKFSKHAAFAFAENDAALPNVLIYGDSISIGYTEEVRKSLNGKANVYRIYCNGGDSGSFVKKMSKMLEVMGDKKNDGYWSFGWDVIHFNVGLHDLKYVVEGKLNKKDGEQVNSTKEYANNLKGIVSYLNKLAPKAKLIFATTTPVPESEWGRFAGDAVKYNKAALKAMQDSPEIVVNDLYGFIKPKMSQQWMQSGNVHYSREESKILGGEVARVILKTLNSEGKAKQTAEAGTSKDIKPDKFLVYKTVKNKNDVEDELRLHVFNPAGLKAGDKRAVIVFFFGGGWTGGSPSQFYRQCEYFAGRGMVAISAEYRIERRNGTSPRECVIDGKSAVRWIRRHARELGIDPDRLAAGGGSAGGHVAAATGTVKGFNEAGEDLSVSAVPNTLVLFNPVYDNSPDGYGYDRVKEYWKEISPLHNIDKDTPPTIVFMGTRDKLISVAIAENYKRLMEKAGVRSDLHLYEGQKHGFFNNVKYNETVLEADKFLVSLGYLKGTSKNSFWRTSESF